MRQEPHNVAKSDGFTTFHKIMLLWLENGDLGATVLEPQQLYFGKSCKTNGFSKKVNGTNERTHARTD